MLPARVHVPELERPASFPVIATRALSRWRLTRTCPSGSSPPVALSVVRRETALRGTPFSTTTV
ncbi:hypothetical protein [Microvirga ossetica]|uniref:hypothetical protein n=1 Tax=Microvirga ossetica TaxID=1882682 RepID=UPI0012FFE412|nr:hypothetical protein [Microvirga ossetica]